jgi:hypothetical protein
MYVSSNLVKKWGVKCLGKVATQPASLEKKMNGTLRFSPSICDLFLSTPLIGFELLILFNFTHEELQFKPQISVRFSLWSLVLDLCNLTLNWSINFQFLQFDPWFGQFQSLYLRAFSNLVLGFGFFNQVPNWPSKFNIYAIKPLIWQNQLLEILLWPQNFNFFQLKPKLTLKSIFLVIKPYINSIKPPIKFNWVHKHLILDFFPPIEFFFVNRARHL